MGNWPVDLAAGNLAEIAFAKLLQRRKPGHTPEFNADHRWDVKYGDLTFECKADAMTSSTGNVCIEYEWRGNPSGITTSEAKYYAVLANGLWHIAFTDVVRYYMEDYPVTTCGDSRMGRAYLIPLPAFRELCDAVFDTNGVRK